MAVVTVAEVLRRAEEFEQAIAGFYAKVADRTSRDGVRLLAGHMSRHRVRLVESLDCLPSEEVAVICSTPLRFEPEGADCHCLKEIELPVAATAAEFLDTALNFDECLIRFYRGVIRQPVKQEVRVLFEEFICLEERDEIELKKIKAMDYF